MLTDEQVLRWFGSPDVAFKNALAAVPKSLQSEVRILKQSGYTDKEAFVAMQPSLKRLAASTENK